MTALEPVEQERASALRRRWLALIVGLAVGLRLALAIVHPILSYDDSKDYDALARAIVHHQPYELKNNAGETLIAVRMPGYPVLIAGVYAIVGEKPDAVLILQAAMGGVIVYVTYRLARAAGENAALGAALLTALDPLSVGFGAALLSETAFTLCMLGALCVCVRLTREDRPFYAKGWGWWALLGLLWGAAVYLRASALWLIVPLAAWTAIQPGQDWRMALKRLSGALLTVLLVIATLSPWLIRNYADFRCGFLRLTTLEGISLYEAVYPDADGGPRQDKISLPPDMIALNEAQRNDEWMRRAWHFVATDPVRIARLAIVKIGRTWSPVFNASEFAGGPIQWGMAIWYIPLLFLGLIGVLGGAIPGRVRGLFLIPVAYFTLMHALFLGSVRYRAPLMPVVCVFAAAGIVFMVNRFSRGKRMSSGPV